MQGSHPEFDIDGDLITTSSIYEGNGELDVTGITQDENTVPPPAPHLLPGIDFSYFYDQAGTRLPNDAALDASPDLNGIVWVNTPASINRDTTINGLLVVNGNLTIDNNSVITVNNATGTPSGIIVNGNIIITETPVYSGDITINGLLYATGSITLEKLDIGYIFKLTGGMVSGNGILIKNCSRTIQIVYDNQILVDSLISSADSPVIVIDHWEEEY